MTILPIGSDVRLAGNTVHQFAIGISQSIECIEGAIWITQPNEPRDIVLAAGERMLFRAPGKSLLVGPINGAAVVRAVGAPCLDMAA